MAASIQIIQGRNVEDTIQNPISTNSIFLSPTTPSEVEQLINEIDCNKSIRQCDVDTKFIKYSKTIISTPLSEIFNMCNCA